MIKIKFFLLSFVLAGSQFPSSASEILATFNEKIIAGDTNALQSIIETNSKYIDNPAAEQYRNKGLLLAVQEGHSSIVELLLKNANVDIAVNNNEAIRLASAKGNINIVRNLLNHPQVDPGALDDEAIIKAARKGHADVVRLLLAHPRVKSSARNYLAVFTAIRKNHADIVKLLINNERYIPTSAGFFLIEQAAQFGNADLVQFFLNHQSLKRVVFTLFYSDKLESIKAAVEAGYIFDQPTLDFFLQHYRSYGNEDIIKYLESLKKLPTKPLVPMTEQCAICLSDENLFKGYMTSCNHQFHAECLQQWISKHNTCPMCRSSII